MYAHGRCYVCDGDRMKENKNMWKCPKCGRLISDALHRLRKEYGVCNCKESLYWDFDEFTLDKSDSLIPPDYDLTSYLDGIIDGSCSTYCGLGKIIEVVKEKAYHDGYEEGLRHGMFIGNHDGWNRGYDIGFKNGIIRG